MADGRLLAVLNGHSAAVNAVAISADGRHVLTMSDDSSARVWDTTGQLVRVLSGHDHWVTSVTFSPDGCTLATTSHDHSVRLWQQDRRCESLKRVGSDGRELRSRCHEAASCPGRRRS